MLVRTSEHNHGGEMVRSTTIGNKKKPKVMESDQGGGGGGGGCGCVVC